MADIGRIAFAGFTAALESTQALANLNFDFSIVKLEAPREFHDLGSLLTHSRRETAEDGPLHVTARRLGAIFASVLPQTPELIRCYGLRASEIARESTENAPVASFGIFAQQVGIDGASIWAGATSGANAIQLHLLACMLARIWSGPEAISVWVELLKSRREAIQVQVAGMDPVDISTVLAAKQEISREQLAEWDASARAWLRIADYAKRLQQKQLLLIIGNMDAFVNSKPVLYDSVIKAWTTGLTGMEELLSGSPLDMRSGELPLALASWHLYPDLNIIGPATKIVHQKDTLVPESGILTIGLQGPNDSESNGLQWSLPLAHLRFYGGPANRSQTIRCEGARLSLAEFNMAVLGCVLSGWDVKDKELERVILWVRTLASILQAFCTGQTNLNRTWLSVLGEASRVFLTSEDLERKIFRKILNLGRRQHGFIRRPSRPFFGLCNINSAVAIARNSEEKVAILRAHAARASLYWNHSIIRYISDVTGGEEFASATSIPTTTVKRASSEETKKNARHVRWIPAIIPPGSQPVAPHSDVKTDAFLGTSAHDADVPHSQSQLLGPRDQPDAGSPEPAPQPSVGKDSSDTILDVQRDRFQEMGEEVRLVGSEPIKTIAPLAKPARVVWGEPAVPSVADWDAYDHWYGEMKHYEYCLGDPHSAAMFVRLDQSMPRDNTVPFAELGSLFERRAISPSGLAHELATSLEQDDKNFVGALKAVATMNSLYNGLTQATVDVKIFEHSLAETEWFSSLAGDLDWMPHFDGFTIYNENENESLEVAPAEVRPEDGEDDEYTPHFF